MEAIDKETVPSNRKKGGIPIFDVMFYGGMCFSILFFGFCIVLFKRDNVAELARDVLGRKRGPIVYDVQEDIGFPEEMVTDVLVIEEACAEQFFEVVEDTVVTHTNQTIKERSCL